VKIKIFSENDLGIEFLNLNNEVIIYRIKITKAHHSYVNIIGVINSF
jgi:hypothetical protein